MGKALHIICGKCGSNEDLSFQIKHEEVFDNDDNIIEYKYYTSISCNNCGTLTNLDDIIKEE